MIDYPDIDINFMKEQGKYLIDVTNKNIITSWINFYPCIKTLLNTINSDFNNIRFELYFIHDELLHTYGGFFDITKNQMEYVSFDEDNNCESSVISDIK